MEETKLGRYAIQSELGRGAMGVVYKAKDTALERTVAVKTVNMALEKDGAEKYEARFYQEARAAGSLNHPNIVTVYDVGKEENVTALMYQIVNFAPPAPSTVNPAVPELLNFIVAKMLAKPLEERYQNAQELSQDLRNCERQISTPSAITQPVRPMGLASGAQP